MLWYWLWRIILYTEVGIFIAIVLGIYSIIAKHAMHDFYASLIVEIPIFLLLKFLEKKVNPKADRKYNEADKKA